MVWKLIQIIKMYNLTIITKSVILRMPMVTFAGSLLKVTLISL